MTPITRRISVGLRESAGLGILLLFSGALAEAEVGTFQVSFAEVRDSFTLQGHLSVGETRFVRFRLDTDNLTEVVLRLVWNETDDALKISGPDRFALRAVDPSGAPTPREFVRSTEGKIEVRVPLAVRPSSFSVENTTAESVQERLKEFQSPEGKGDWRAEIHLEDAGNPPRLDSDKGNDFRLWIFVYRYEATVMRVVTLRPPQTSIFEGGGSSPIPWDGAAFALGGVSLLLALVLLRTRKGR